MPVASTNLSAKCLRRNPDVAQHPTPSTSQPMASHTNAKFVLNLLMSPCHTSWKIEVGKIILQGLVQYSVHAKLVFVSVQFERSPSRVSKSTCAMAPTECGQP